MNLDFVERLDALRDRCWFPFAISSGYRTAAHNAKVEGVDGSAHVAGLAADIRVADGRQRIILVREALVMGFGRIGIGHNFVHLDVDPTKPQNVMWVY